MMITRRRFVHSMAAATTLGGWRDDETQAIVLGSVQDGGFPQAGCYSVRCDRARSHPRYVASLALVQPHTERYYLVDATPDIRAQMDLIPGAAFRERAMARRPFDGIFLTHAHIGHYLGLALLGNEGLGITRTPCYCTPRMADFLRTNGPWSLMVEQERLLLEALPLGDWYRVDPELEVRAVPVPHRQEYSDTVGFVFRARHRALLYLPDVDRWERMHPPLEDVVNTVDVALLDGSFYSASEIPGRNLEDLPHPLIPHTMAYLQPRLRGTREIVFTHFNNTNAVLDAGSAAERHVLTEGFALAREGTVYRL